MRRREERIGYKRGWFIARLRDESWYPRRVFFELVAKCFKKQFSSVPKWAEERLVKLSAKEFEELSVRVHNAKSIETLLK